MYGHSYLCSTARGGPPGEYRVRLTTSGGPRMPRIGTVIREVCQRPGAAALPAHLDGHYGIRVTGTARLAEGVFRVDHDAGPPWVARIMLASRPVDRTEEDAGVLRFLDRRGFPAE